MRPGPCRALAEDGHSDILHLVDECAIAFGLHFLARNEAECGGIDAVTQPTPVLGTVWEHMAKMTVTMRGAYFGADHTVRAIPQLVDIRGYDRLREARPAAAGFELVRRGEQGFAGNDVDVDTRSLVVVILSGEWAFGAVLLGHTVLFGRKLSDRFVGLCVGHCMSPAWFAALIWRRKRGFPIKQAHRR
ncbi:hypothetical protein EMEDMD4_790389 [Sinorhizobium medicae]|uniref:Uncharacterized protein n=1 Tax=Sinorhizobium medicae TaxID=110321 RepID=A0A508X675_9HYPH|nr:hypothetical protein EMEDMD4_790389 [Sinorhizobium medicae]